MPLTARYSRWDGSQEIPELEAGDILEALSDDLMNFGDLQHALRNLMQRGMRSQDGMRAPGLRDLLHQLRQQRRQRLDRFGLDGAMGQIERQLDEILGLERETLAQRLGEAGGPSAPQADGGGEAAGGETGADAGAGQPDGGGPDGREGDAPAPPQAAGGTGSGGADGGDDFSGMLRRIVERKRQFLDGLPEQTAGRVRALQDYEFLDPEAQRRFRELVDQLRRAVTESFFRDVSKMAGEMSEGDVERMKRMARDLNDMLVQRMRGEQPDFGAFMDEYGDMFGDRPPQSLDDLIAQMQAQTQALQSLMESLPADQREQLRSLLADKLGDPELEGELTQLAQNLEYLHPAADRAPAYPFRGGEDLDLRAAMRLMGEMQRIDELERQVERAQYDGGLDGIDADRLRELLGDEAADSIDRLGELLDILERAGYIRREGGGWALTPRGARMIGQRALAEIYAQLKRQGIGNHPVPESGRHGERTEDTRGYEFGDPFHLHMGRTLMNAIERDGPRTPVRLLPGDFEIHRSEQLTETATAVMVDLSWSMALRGSFQSAKKVALALHNLISAQYPRDRLYILGFSAYARELQLPELPYVRWDESVLGTNMHHALMLARRKLARHAGGTRQIIMISDGEPTAHLERGRSQFSYPPSPATIRETLKEVRRCTREGITINTFMLDRNYYLKEFVNQLAKINGGRVFYTTPDRLGEYILVDYVRHKRKRLGRSA